VEHNGPTVEEPTHSGCGLAVLMHGKVDEGWRV
jgi:hypothetical protein